MMSQIFCREIMTNGLAWILFVKKKVITSRVTNSILQTRMFLNELSYNKENSFLKFT